MSELNISLKKLFLYALIVSVCASAVLGIIAILSGDFGDLQVKVLLTSLTISGASLAGLCCGAAFEAHRGRYFACAGMLLGAVAALLILIGIWGEVSQDAFWKATATVSVFAAGFAHTCLLRLARLSRRYLWTFWAAYVLVFGLCTIISGMLWVEPQNDWSFRIMGVNAILVGAVSLLIPIFHRLSRDEIPSSERDRRITLAEIDDEIARHKQRIEELERRKLRVLEQLK
jgi:hypothetical protein